MAAENNTVIAIFSNGRSNVIKRKLESLDTGGVMNFPVPSGYNTLVAIYVTATSLVYADVDDGHAVHNIPKAADTGLKTGFFPLNTPCSTTLQVTIHQ